MRKNKKPALSWKNRMLGCWYAASCTPPLQLPSPVQSCKWCKIFMKKTIFYFAPYLYYGSKIIRSNGSYPTFFSPMFANCVHASIGSLFTSEREIFFSPNCSRFAVECDWNSKISQNVQNLFFFFEKRWVFRKKSLNFFKIAKSGKFAVECVSNGIISFKKSSALIMRFFRRKIRKIWTLEK